jgi:hypothetical protein
LETSSTAALALQNNWGPAAWRPGARAAPRFDETTGAPNRDLSTGRSAARPALWASAARNDSDEVWNCERK